MIGSSREYSAFEGVSIWRRGQRIIISLNFDDTAAIAKTLRLFGYRWLARRLEKAMAKIGSKKPEQARRWRESEIARICREANDGPERRAS